MNSLDTLPEELIALVLQSCDSFSQLRNLILSSKTLYSIWACNQRTILWHVGQTAIPGFSDALIAVRATEISKEAVLRGELPPDPFPVLQLSGDTHKPSLDEVKHVQEFSHLAQYLETRTRCPAGRKESFLPDKWYFDSLAWKSRTWQVWREGYHRAVYRYLTAGAVLCRAYYAPLVSDAKPPGFLFSLLAVLEGIAARDSEYPAWFTEQEQRYLSTIPLYDSQRPRKWETAFRPLEELFLNESRKQAHSESRNSPRPSEGLDKSLYRTFGSKAKNLHSLSATHAETLFQQILQFLNLVDGDIRCLISLPGDTPLENTSDPISHSISAFLFGSFTLSTINIRQAPCGIHQFAFASPVLPPLDSKTLLQKPPPPTTTTTSTPNTTTAQYLSFPNMHNFLKKVWDVGGIPNCYSDPIRKTPPPISFFAEHMLRKYFGLRFAFSMFDSTIEIRCAWYAFHQFGGVFTGFAPLAKAMRYVGEDLLRGVDEVWPMACYDEYAWYY